MGNPIILLEVTSINDNALSTATNYAFVVDQIGTIVANGSGSDLMYRSPQSVPTRFTVSQSPSDIVALAASETPSEIIDSITASITAFAGGGQGSAVQLTSTVNNITTVATAGDSVKLPEAVAGLVVIVQNNGANSADVFPATGETINGGSANAAVALPAGARMEFIGTTTSNWTTDRGYALITDIVASKEVDHVFSVTDTTTAATAGGAITITAGKAGTSGTGGAAAVNGGVGGTTGTGGAVNITSGAGGTTSGNSGAVNLKSAAETGTDLSGAVAIASGTTVTANTGAVSVASGVATTGNSGAVTVLSGAVTTGNSGGVTISTGNAGTGASGDITLSPGTASTVVGKVITSNAVVMKHKTAAINATATATAKEVATGYITSTSAAAVTLTLPTGTLLGGELGAAQGTIFDLTIDNTAGANTVTVAVAVNGIQSAWSVYQDVGGATLDVVSGVTGTAVYRLVFSSATAYTFCRIA